MNAEIGTDAAQFPEKEYINGIFFAVYKQSHLTIYHFVSEALSPITLHTFYLPFVF
jgi:hypothetical protein